MTNNDGLYGGDCHPKMFLPTRDVPEPQHWESRENYNERTSLHLSPEDWIELVAATVYRHGGILSTAF
jgi:hypothetical protein